MLPLLILIIIQVFSPLQVIPFKRSCFRWFGGSLLFIHTGSTEEPGVLLQPPSPWLGRNPFLTLEFPGFIAVLTACMVLLPQLSSAFLLLWRKKKSFVKPLAKSFCPEQNLACEFPLNAYLCLSLRLAFRSLEWGFKGTKLYLKKGSIYIGLMLKTF